MKSILNLFGWVFVIAAVGLSIAFTRPHSPKIRSRVRRASMMDAEPEAMSIFSADHVRMLSEAQLQALEADEEEVL